MRALMKGTAAAFFKKQQKPKQDIENIMNQIQTKQIALLIGISQDQIPSMSQFFQQVQKLKLPQGYIRYPNNQKNKVIYRNDFYQIQTHVHPSINLIKALFYKILANNKSVYTFQMKQKKLLPYVQEKMMRFSIGINSKRRDAQKVNLQRDQQGKMVLSKQTRIIPDVKPLISSRSYLLKMLVQKIYTKKQIWGRGKRANIYATILSSYHSKMRTSQPQKDDIQDQTQISLEKYQSIFQTTCLFYQQQFGDVDVIPQKIMRSQQYLRGTPQNVLRNTYILNIDKNNLQLYWLARMMDCLPLPPYWNLKLGSSFTQYYYQPQNLTFQIHPSYIYIVKQMNRFRSNFLQLDQIQQNFYTNMRQMIFFDYFQRPYSVDFYAVISKNQQQDNNKNDKKNKKLKNNINNMTNCDWMIIQGVKNCNIYQSCYHLTQKIQYFWNQIDFKQQTYAPAISPFGQVVWSSNITGRCINYCPYVMQLTQLIDHQQKLIPDVQQWDIKPSLKQLSPQMQKLYMQQIPQQRIKFLKYFIKHQPLPLAWPYQTKTQKYYYQKYFISSFNLQQDLNKNILDDPPLWLQKVHAKKMIVQYFTLLDKFPQKFSILLKNFSQYAIRKTLIHQPTRQQQIQLKIAKIHNKIDFKKFIQQFNDIDLRQQRKKLLLIKDQIIQDDVFGSSISNIDLDQKDSDQQQNQNILDSQQQQNNKSNQSLKYQPQINIQSSDQNQQQKQNPQKQQKQQIKIIIQQNIIKRQQKRIYKIYQKNKNIQILSDNKLNQQINNKHKKNLKKYKFIKNKLKLKKLNNKKLQLKSIKKQIKQNILITNFKYSNVPYKNINNIIKKNNNKLNKIQQYDRCSNISNLSLQSIQFTQFQSQMSQYFNDDIQQDIKKWQLLNQTNNKIQNNSLLNNFQRKKQIDQTSHTIVLQPIKRSKPLIDQDPFLISIHQFQNVKQFKKSFKNGLVNLNVDKKDQKLNKINSLGSLKDKFKSSSFSTLKKYNQIPLTTTQNQFQKKLSIFENIQTVRTSLNKNQSNIHFNRVCLGKTANHFLSTEAVTRKCDLASFEARKTLLAKNRGLQTYIAKKY